MKALCWCGVGRVSVQEVPDPQIINPRDIVIRITSTAICGSDLHLYNGFMPTLMKGDIVGHEFMGEVVEVGPGVKNLQVGDRVVNPFTISCGNCLLCKEGLFSLCENSNPNAWMAEQMFGYSPCGIYGYTHMLGGYAGGQAQYARIPYGDVGPIKVPDELTDDQVLFLSDIFPTGYMAAEQCDIQPGQVVAVWGCGPVGLFAIQSAYLLGAEKVIAIDRFPERLRMARDKCRAETIDYEEVEVLSALREMTGGRGPDACIDAVGMEAHCHGVVGTVDRLKQAMLLQTDRPHALREAIIACRPGGVLSIPGVYGGWSDKVMLGAIMNKALRVRTGQTHVQKYLRPLLERIQRDEIDPSFVITHRLSLNDAPSAYQTFRDKQDGCIKVVLDPWS